MHACMQIAQEFHSERAPIFHPLSIYSKPILQEICTVRPR